jgi:hypothetical protein
MRGTYGQRGWRPGGGAEGQGPYQKKNHKDSKDLKPTANAADTTNDNCILLQLHI